MGLLCSQSRSQQRFKMSVNVCPDDTFWITEHLATKFGMVMQHHEPESCGHFCCCCYLQGQGHSKGSYHQNMTLSTILSELLIPWQPNLVWWYIIKSQSVLWKKKLISAFRLKVTVKVQNVSECVSGWYLLNCRSFWYQIWYGNAASWVRVLCRKVG